MCRRNSKNNGRNKYFLSMCANRRKGNWQEKRDAEDNFLKDNYSDKQENKGGEKMMKDNMRGNSNEHNMRGNYVYVVNYYDE